MARQQINTTIQALGANTLIGGAGYVTVNPTDGMATPLKVTHTNAFHIINALGTTETFKVAMWDNHETEPGFPSLSNPPTLTGYDTFSIPSTADGVIIGGLRGEKYKRWDLVSGKLVWEIYAEVTGPLIVGLLVWR